MEIDAPLEHNNILSPRDRIILRLIQYGVPREQLDQLQPGLVDFIGKNKPLLPELVYAILPTDADVSEVQVEAKPESEGGSRRITTNDLFGESLLWIQWLMFEDEPQALLKALAQRTAGQRAVCGAVWGHKDLAYRCRTCEHDPTCAICVPCFQNGNHKDHDYSIMYTGGGCCDCGDVTAWKRKGFCSKHKGTEQIQPLPKEIADSVGPVLDALLACWRDRLLLVETNAQRHPKVVDHVDVCGKAVNELSCAAIEMLLDFCNCSESLLSYISKRIYESVGLLDLLIRAEMFLDKDKRVVRKLHELLLKLLGEPLFKYEFAKAFIKYYPITVKEIVKECTDSTLEKHPLLSTFSVQIFTVPTLTPRLVREVDLLGILLECLGNVLQSCVGEDGRLQVNKWANLYETTIRLIEDTRYVMSHDEVPKYIARQRPDISITWIRLLALVQGMDPHKRLTGLHTEEENENLHMPFMLGHYLGNVQNLLVEGAFSLDEAEEMKENSFFSMDVQVLDDGERLRHAKVGKLSQESSACCMSSKTSKVNFRSGNCFSIPPSVTWLIFECLKAIENWLGPDTALKTNLSSFDASGSSDSKISTLRKKLFRIRKGRNSTKVYRTSMFLADSDSIRLSSQSELHEGVSSSSPIHGITACLEGERREPLEDNSPVEADFGKELEALGILSLTDWPEIVFDVGSQEVSFHIPLHRLLSLLLCKAMKTCHGENRTFDTTNGISTLPLPCYHDFFGLVLGGLHPYGFSSFLMEHPLRLRVFCAQVRAGMWRRNADAGVLLCDWYRAVRWFEIGAESDLFLFQCCAALAPPELLVKRIQERFGLSDYLSLNLAEHNEYEPVLVQEMLTLIIQIVKERRFCGLSTTENLRRELVYKLAIGDATHSQLVKALPRDLSKSDQLQEVLDTLAVYVNPSGMKQGKYSLRKAYWKELDLYHPRWNSRDLQVAEERYLRFCKVSALNVQLPRWMPVFDPLSTMYRIATSKAVLQIIRAVLFYAVFTDMSYVSRAPDGVVVTALHLLSLALDICDRKRACTNKVGADVDLFHSCDQSCVGIAEDSFPLLMYATENINEATDKGPAIWKNQSMLSLLVLLMRKYNKENDHDHADTRLCNISSLIGSLLKKFAQLNADCMTELKQLAPGIVGHMPLYSSDSSVQKLAIDSDVVRKAKARERQAAILEKMKAEQSKFIASLKSTENNELDISISKQKVAEPCHIQEESAPVCSLCRDTDSKSPVSFLILLQKSRLSSFVDRGPPSWEETSQLDKGHHSVCMEGVIDMGDSTSSEMFPSSHLAQLLHNVGREFAYVPTEPDVVLDFVRARLPDFRGSHQLNASYDTNMNIVSLLEMMENDIYQSIQEELYAVKLRPDLPVGDEKYSISLDAEGSKNSRNAESSVLGENIKSVLRETSKHQPSVHGRTQLTNASPNTVPTAAFDRFGPVDCDGIHISSCGHAVHQECHDRYLYSLKQRYIRRLVFEGGHIVDPDLGELLCPVCRRFANSILPVFPVKSNGAWKQLMLSDGSSASAAGSSTSSASDSNNPCLQHAISLLRSTAKMVGQDRFLKVLSGKLSEAIDPSLEPVLRKLCMMYFPHSYASLSASVRLSHSLILWDTLRYTIISTEIAARGTISTRSDGSNSGLEALYGELHSSNGFILSLLLQVAQASRCLNRVHVLLRFRGIQLLADSICSGFSGASDFHIDRRIGILSSILGPVDKGEASLDIQYWKRAADPILAHDPFSSLMLVLFSLPLSFISSTESFISLVHLFYVVCVIQALITCHSKHHFDMSSFGNCLLNDICKTMGESELVRQHFVSNYVDDLCHPKDLVRRFTFPYLRRCALLWKLLQSSTFAPCYDNSHMWNKLTPSMDNDALDGTGNLSVELKGVRELEHVFQIHSLDVVLKDKIVHGLALKLCEHFCSGFNVHNNGHILYSTPAVPFRLMRLPHLYQDLLQRYIKQQCPECKSVPDEPALCLLCGRLCSPSWKSCCRESKCQSHAMACGAGIGVFLLVKRTTILLQRSARQAPWPSPYLDAFGEEDLDMYRGKPLYLSEERYAALTYLVASHGLDRSSEVLRQTTISLYGLD